MIKVRTFQHIERFVEKSARIFALIGGLGLLFATAATCFSIIFKLIRRLLDTSFGTSDHWAFIRPILGEEELVQYGVGFALFSVLPYLMLKGGHIKVDLLKSYFSIRVNLLLNFFGDVALTIFAYLIMTRQWGLIFKKTRKNQETLPELFLQGDFASIADRVRSTLESQVLGVPLWPLYLVAEACIIAFFLVAVFCCIRSLHHILHGVKPLH